MVWVVDKVVGAEENLRAVEDVDRAERVAPRLLDRVACVFALNVATSRRTQWASHATRWFVPSVARA